MDRTKWLTVEELAEYLKIGRTKPYRMASEGTSRLPRSAIDSVSTGRKSTSG
ncbi:MAG: excisionase family DNA-binding protein [Paenibacillus sp.]|nr:excisionase family DNA-binding protein [Paenibacillus sp.]